MQRDYAAEAGSLLTYFLRLFRGENQELFAELRSIRRTMEDILATQEDFKQGIARIDAATTAIADRLRQMKDQIGNMDAAQEDAAKADLERVAAALEAMGSDPTNPVPVPVPEFEDTLAGGTANDQQAGGTDTLTGGEGNSGAQP